MEILGRAWLVAAVSVAAGCDILRTPDPIDMSAANVTVHAVLTAGTDTARVLVVPYHPSADAGGRFQRLTGARVTLSGGTQSLLLPEAPAGFSDCEPPPTGRGARPIEQGCYAVHIPGGIRSGETFRLQMVLPGGDLVLGETTVPEPPMYHAPRESERFAVGSGLPEPGPPIVVKLSWTSSAPGGKEEAGPFDFQGFKDGMPLQTCAVWGGHDVLTRGGTDLQILGAGCSNGGRAVAWDSIRVVMRLTAYDSAYAWYRANPTRSTRLGGTHSSGLRGALGAFGSASPGDPRTIVLVPRK